MRRRLPIAFGVANLLGVVALAWPLVLAAPVARAEADSHAADAPIVVALLVPLLVIAALREAQGGARGASRPNGPAAGARLVAMLGTLAAVNAVLRIPKGPTGEGLMFPLPILAGWTLGAQFGFLLGSFSILVSAVLTGGVGPWLPFQMFALGWVGMGAGVVRNLTGSRFGVLKLGVYAWVSSLAFGFVTTLWFWPFMGRDGPAFYEPGLGLAGTFVRYWRFYLLTSLGWDTGRALLTNVPLVLVLRRPVGRLLARAGERFAPVILPAPGSSPAVADGGPHRRTERPQTSAPAPAQARPR